MPVTFGCLTLGLVPPFCGLEVVVQLVEGPHEVHPAAKVQQGRSVRWLDGADREVWPAQLQSQNEGRNPGLNGWKRDAFLLA